MRMSDFWRGWFGACFGMLIFVGGYFGVTYNMRGLPEGEGNEEVAQGLMSSTQSRLYINGRVYKSIECATKNNDVICKVRR